MHKDDNIYILNFEGTITDGEFHSLRSQGESGPLHLWQLIHDSREAASRLAIKTMYAMLFPSSCMYFFLKL